MNPELLLFVTLHTLDGREIAINQRAIMSITRPAENSDLFNAKVGCVVSLIDSKFISTKESCREVVLSLRDQDDAKEPTGGYLDRK